jgi:23S rRNA pseudouridine955/2504/2580 synthase
MQTQTFTVACPQKLSAFIKQNVFGSGFAFVQTALKNKDIKINGVRVSADIMLSTADTVQIYYRDDAIKDYTPYRMVFEDKNVAVVFKEQGIETVSEQNENTLEKRLNADAGATYIACHRLDFNTEGLVVFAKSKPTADEIKTAFENGQVHKTYFALCFGQLRNSPVTLTGYLQKDKEQKTVKITKERMQGAVPIKTVVEFVKPQGEFSLLKITPKTGRTHQIRAHLASVGLYIVGDGKYGEAKLNRLYEHNKQCLSATALSFNFPATSPLHYLNEKTFEIKPSFL